MIAFLIFMVTITMMQNEKQMFDFSSPNSSGEWRIINDIVMGGVSKSSFVLGENGIAKFSGTLSPDNNGGFASVRAYADESDLGKYDGVIIKAKGDGNIYNLRFRTDQNYDGVSYQAKFKSDNEEWNEYKISFNDFKPTFRGRLVPNQPELKSENIKQIGILIADKQFGEFELEVKWIKFYKDEIE